MFQDLIDVILKKRSEALDKIALFLLEEKKFYNAASDLSKGFYYTQLRPLDFEDYYRYKATVHNCDLLVRSIRDSKNLKAHLEIFSNIIAKHTRYPYQSTNPISNHEKLIENSVRQELFDFVNDWIKNSSKERKMYEKENSKKDS